MWNICYFHLSDQKGLYSIERLIHCLWKDLRTKEILSCEQHRQFTDLCTCVCVSMQTYGVCNQNSMKLPGCRRMIKCYWFSQSVVSILIQRDNYSEKANSNFSLDGTKTNQIQFTFFFLQVSRFFKTFSTFVLFLVGYRNAHETLFWHVCIYIAATYCPNHVLLATSLLFSRL